MKERMERRLEGKKNGWMEGRTDRQTKRQTDEQTRRQSDSQTERQTDRKTERQTDIYYDRQTNKNVESTITSTLRFFIVSCIVCSLSPIPNDFIAFLQHFCRVSYHQHPPHPSRLIPSPPSPPTPHPFYNLSRIGFHVI